MLQCAFILQKVGKMSEKILCFVDMISMKNRSLCEFLNTKECLNISPLNDENFKANLHKCEIASVSFVLALLCKMSGIKGFESFDEGYLSGESCFGEEEATEVLEFLNEARAIVFDKNTLLHKDWHNINAFLNALCQKFKLFLYPSDITPSQICLDTNKVYLQEQNLSFSSPKELDNYDNLVLFNTPLNDKQIHCSKQFLQLAKAKENDEISFLMQDIKAKARLVCDEKARGNVAFFDFSSLEKGTKLYDFIQIKLA